MNYIPAKWQFTTDYYQVNSYGMFAGQADISDYKKGDIISGSKSDTLFTDSVYSDGHYIPVKVLQLVEQEKWINDMPVSGVNPNQKLSDWLVGVPKSTYVVVGIVIAAVLFLIFRHKK